MRSVSISSPISIAGTVSAAAAAIVTRTGSFIRRSLFSFTICFIIFAFCSVCPRRNLRLRDSYLNTFYSIRDGFFLLLAFTFFSVRFIRKILTDRWIDFIAVILRFQLFEFIFDDTNKITDFATGS